MSNIANGGLLTMAHAPSAFGSRAAVGASHARLLTDVDQRLLGVFFGELNPFLGNVVVSPI